jgi:2'-5' RNA ligase
LVDVQKELETTGADLKLVEPKNIHATIKFLGNISDDKLSDVKRAIQKAASVVDPYDAHVEGLGAFPKPHYIRVIWAGVMNGKNETRAIHQQLERELRELGFVHDHDFTPHLTLARVRSGQRRDELALRLRELSDVKFGTSRIEAIELKESKLTPEGPIYSTLERFDIGK